MSLPHVDLREDGGKIKANVYVFYIDNADGETFVLYDKSRKFWSSLWITDYSLNDLVEMLKDLNDHIKVAYFKVKNADDEYAVFAHIQRYSVWHRPQRLLDFLTGGKNPSKDWGGCPIATFWERAEKCAKGKFSTTTTERMLNAQSLGIFKRLDLPEFGEALRDDILEYKKEGKFAEVYQYEESDWNKDLKEDVARAQREEETIHYHVSPYDATAPAARPFMRRKRWVPKTYAPPVLADDMSSDDLDPPSRFTPKSRGRRETDAGSPARKVRATERPFSMRSAASHSPIAEEEDGEAITKPKPHAGVSDMLLSPSAPKSRLQRYKEGGATWAQDLDENTYTSRQLEDINAANKMKPWFGRSFLLARELPVDLHQNSGV
jgi:hypothetical protein